MRYQDGMTGRLFEAKIGNCTQRHVEGTYVSYHKALDLVRKNQGKKSEIIRQLEEKMSVLLGRRVVGFVAIGSTLDLMHSIDTFFEFAGHPGLATVTVDFTVNTHKTCGKADLVVGLEVFEHIDQTALSIARELRAKLMRAVH